MSGTYNCEAAVELVKTYIAGKKAPKIGVTPAVALINPKHARNVGAAIRVASCYGVKQVLFTGDRITLDEKAKTRLPREERMKGYLDVEVFQNDYPFDMFPSGVTPVAVEIRPNVENLFDFEHPDNPLYVFGPEDGSIPKVVMQHCHRFVVIPTRHCLNLAMAIGTVLYDRAYKLYKSGKGDVPIFPGEWEGRGIEEALGELFTEEEG